MTSPIENDIVYYYGQAPFAKPKPGGFKLLHIGNFVEYVSIGRGRKQNTVVTAFCGVLMFSWDEGRSFPVGRAGDFCKNCFRSVAWDFMVYQMEAKAHEQDVSTRLKSLLGQAQQENWDRELLMVKISILADELNVREEELFVPPERDPVRTNKDRAKDMLLRFEEAS